MWKRIKICLVSGLIALSSVQPVQASEMAGDLCPNANVLSSIIDGICWSCLLPIRLAGIGGSDVPNGASSPSPFCACMDDWGIPEIGMPLGFYQPNRIVSFTPTPYCMPSFGERLSNDNTRAGQGRTDTALDDTETSFFHYKYWIFPVMQMIEMFANADCTYDSMTTLDLAYFSEADPLYQSDMLAFVLAPETAIFANPIATSICTADCATIMAGGSVETNYFCAGCAGNMYPLTGNNQYSDDPIRGTDLLTTRLLAGLHRKGQALKTMGNHMTSGSCDPEYSPMIPKPQYRASMLYPVRESSPTPPSNGNNVPGAGGSSPTPPSNGNNVPGAGGSSPTPPPNGNNVPAAGGCCHKLGDSTLKWGNARLIPGREAFVYLLYSWNDCCLR